MPRTTSAKNQRPAWGRTTPTDRMRPVARADARGEAAYPSSSAAARTLVRVSRETLGRPRRARETVAADTPACRATSRIPTPRGSPGRPAVLTPFATPSPYPTGLSRAVSMGRPVAASPWSGQRTLRGMPGFAYAELLPRGEEATPYRLLTREGVRVV